jgi:hypothetical protein
MMDLRGETLVQMMVALLLMAVFVGAVRLVDHRYKRTIGVMHAPVDVAWHRPQAAAVFAGGERNMRRAVVPSVLLAGLLFVTVRPAAAEPAGAEPGAGPSAAILDVGMVGQNLRITMGTAGLQESQGDEPSLTVSAWLDGVPIRAVMPLIHMPPRFAMDLDLPEGIVRVGGVAVGSFAPVARFRENLRFPVEVTIHRGAAVATARTTAMIPLPAVIVPGYLNEWGGPSKDLLAAFHRRGYTVAGPGQNVFWFTYPSQQVSLPEAASALAAYVRGVVLPATYAARVNVVGYSLGGLMARWNVAYDVDGWGTLVNRLALVGVPNEGAVIAYVAAHAPSVLPFAALGRRPATMAFLPTFPFWRSDPNRPWTVPPDVDNGVLTELNAQSIPPDIQIYLFYGSNDPRHTGGPQTSEGVTGSLAEGRLSYGQGDGVVLAASAQGLPIRGTAGVPELADRAVARVDLGAVYHSGLLEAGASKIAAALLDRFVDRVDEATVPGN